MAEEIAHTGDAFAFPAGGERVGNATEVGREFVTVASDEVDTDSLCEEDMTLFGVGDRKEAASPTSCLATSRHLFLFRECRADLLTNRKPSIMNVALRGK